MTGKKYDEYQAIVRVPRGGKLSGSKKNPGFSSPLVHSKGKRGVSGQATIKLGKKHSASQTDPKQRSRIARSRQPARRSVTSWILQFAVKCALVILAVAAVLSLLAVVLHGIADGLAAGLERLQVLAADSAEIVALGVGAVISLFVVVWVARMLLSSSGVESHSLRTSAAQHRPAASAGQPTQYRAEPLTAMAGWYSDPQDVRYLRFWDGAIWTQHVQPTSASTQAHTAGWFSDPQRTDTLRWWDGSSWTHHVRSSLPPHEQSVSHNEPRVPMTTAEWQAHVEAWAMTGAAHQELWRRLANAQLIDAEPNTLEAQRRFEHLTADESAHQLRQLAASSAAPQKDNLVAAFMDLLLRQSQSTSYKISRF